MQEIYLKQQKVNGRETGIYSCDLIEQFPLFQQFKKEANIKGSLNNNNYDDFLRVASSYGFTVVVS